jgi:hypothetical protein
MKAQIWNKSGWVKEIDPTNGSRLCVVPYKKYTNF